MRINMQTLIDCTLEFFFMVGIVAVAALTAVLMGA